MIPETSVRSTPADRSGRAPWMEISGAVVRVGHRGAGAFEPQNTRRSFERAISFGVEMVEIDLRRSADGTLVLAHDDEIRDPDGRRMNVSERTFGELREVDLGHGERIPTLLDAIEICAGRCALMIDLKGEGFEADLVRALHAARFADLVIPGGSASSRAIIRALDPTLPISLSLGAEWKPLLTDEFIDSIDTDAVTWRHSLLDGPKVARLHDLKLKVFAWTVDVAEEMNHLVACGVDGIISNRTDLLMQI